MKHIGVVLLAVGAIAFGLAPNRSDEAEADGARSAANADKPAQAQLAQAQWNAGEEVLPRADDGHFYADVTVDGSTVQMLVDTGASTIALTGEDADALGVAWDASAVRPVARGANGLVYGVEVKLDRVSVGGLEVQNVTAVVVPEGLGISLLGQSFLSQIDHVEMTGDAMVLGG